MKDKIDAIWFEFLPLRNSVEKMEEEGQEPDRGMIQKWSDMRNTIVAQYYGLVQKVAEDMHRKIVQVDSGELASMGVDGLYDAVDGFDPNLDIKFETYAAYRIKGAIRDAIRSGDWVPRLVRQRDKQVRVARERLEASMGRAPSNEEMAAELDVSLEEYMKLERSSQVKYVQSLNSGFPSHSEGRHDETEIGDLLADQSTASPMASMMHEEMLAKLFGKGFSSVERQIIYCYHVEKRSMKEIADKVGLSESRVSQMNSAILRRLKDKIKRNPEYFGDKVISFLGDK